MCKNAAMGLRLGCECFHVTSIGSTKFDVDELITCINRQFKLTVNYHTCDGYDGTYN